MGKLCQGTQNANADLFVVTSHPPTHEAWELDKETELSRSISQCSMWTTPKSNKTYKPKNPIKTKLCKGHLKSYFKKLAAI